MQTQRSKLVAHSPDASVLRQISAAAAGWSEVAVAADAEHLSPMLTNDPTISAVVMSTSAATGPRAASFLPALKTLRENFPAIRRILVDDHRDLSVLVNVLHSGAIDRVVYDVNAKDLAAAVSPGK